MYTFDQYLKLSWETKSLATRYGCACLKAHLGVSSAYAMKKQLQTDSERKQFGTDWLNKSSRFFNKKEQGEPIVRRYVVEDIDRRVTPPFSLMNVLCHPLWQLIDNDNPTSYSINEALANLPHRYVQMLFKENGDDGLVRKQKLSREAIWKINQSFDIHALTCLIAFCLESTPENDRLDIDQLLAISYFIKISIIGIFSSISEDFYILLNHKFSGQYLVKDNRMCSVVWPYKAPDKSCIMIPMRIINNCHVNIARAIDTYKKLYQKAIQRGLVKKNDEDEKLFYNFICHTEIQQLSDILHQEDAIPDNFSDLKHLIFERILNCK
jgi:hypothetical protein